MKHSNENYLQHNRTFWTQNIFRNTPLQFYLAACFFYHYGVSRIFTIYP